jgi:hypothetical protein
VLEQQLLEQLLELVQLELVLLFSSKQPEQQPTGRRSAGIFSWIFLSYSKIKHSVAINNYR